MKITGIRAIQLEYQKLYPDMRRPLALVRVETDAGIVGWGEASTSYGHLYPPVLAAIVDSIFSRILVGEDALNMDRVVTKMHLYLDGYLGREGIVSEAIASVEIALWDILGKATGQPICRLLGGHRTAMPLYATGTCDFTKTPEWHGHFFDSAMQRGFKGVKARIGNGYEWDIKMVEAVRRQIGNAPALMVDAYCTYSPQTAIRIAQGLKDFDVYFFEEPVPQFQLEGLARVREVSPVPIAVGERIFSLRSFKEVIEHRAADVLQPDATIAGGILECKKVFALGEAFDLRVLPHMGGLTAVGFAANLHMAASDSRCPFMEYDLNPDQPVRDGMLKDPVFALDRVKDGLLPVPDGPGLGIEVDEEFFEKFPYKGGPVYPPDIFPDLGSGRL
jgi:L-alanine-DL-glutamate epimerase-like enolase superfamily enzyme